MSNELDFTGDVTASLSSRGGNASLRELYAQLGEVLYEETKENDELYLRHAPLYLAIALELRARAGEGEPHKGLT